MRYREVRYPCDFPATLSCDGVHWPVVVVNISPNGARLARSPELEVGTRVGLTLAGTRLTATVRWQRQGRAGVRFDRPQPASLLARVRGRGFCTAQPLLH